MLWLSLMLVNLLHKESRRNDELTERAAHFDVMLDDIACTHITFGKTFTDAVELKQVDQQEAERGPCRKDNKLKFEDSPGSSSDMSFEDAGEDLIELRKIDISAIEAKTNHISTRLFLNLPTQ
ncbi:prohibitin-like [Cimex lectularius]|uniref:Prohibitin n=1 Tax=Cimex lectularius TaxID=79782 RepID=A0A8I6TL74_CIMLE|nr:prohibitin-like [Cimex lectularius]